MSKRVSARSAQKSSASSQKQGGGIGSDGEDPKSQPHRAGESVGGESSSSDDNEHVSESEKEQQPSTSKFELVQSSTHYHSRIGKNFQADVPEYSLQPENNPDISTTDGMSLVWTTELNTSGVDVDSYLSKCRELRLLPKAGALLRHQTSKSITWCVFLRVIEKETGDDGDDVTVRIFSGERYDMRVHNVPLSSILGWSDEAQCLDILVQSNFDTKKAVKQVIASYEQVGYWRDRFINWKQMEVEMLVDGANHNNNVDDLVDTLSTKSRQEVIEFYNHFLRVGNHFNIVMRLFNASYKIRETQGKIDPMDLADSGDGVLRKSKRERSGGRVRLPGEVASDEEESDQQEALSPQQALSAVKTNKTNKKTMKTNERQKSSASGSKSSGSSASKVKLSDSNKKSSNSKSSVVSSLKKARKEKEKEKAVQEDNTEEESSASSKSNKKMKLNSATAAAASEVEPVVAVDMGRQWTNEYVEHQEEEGISTNQRQKELLLKSFEFLYEAQQQLTPKRFSSLVKGLVDFDSGNIELAKLMELSVQYIKGESLMQSFVSFLPDRAKTILENLRNN